MALFSARIIHETTPHAGGTAYAISRSVYSIHRPPVFTLKKTDDPEATTVKPGDQVTMWNVDIHEDAGTYVGTYQGDPIMKSSTYPFTIRLLSGTNYEFGHLIHIDPVPFPVCFVKGTLITTLRGLVAIEDLVEGDAVQGSSGWRAVKWVGWRNYGPVSLLTPENKARITPVRIRAHAIADNVPSSDLLTSPWHHLFVEGKLVRAGDLVNGTTITQETHVTEVSYYHVELDQFDVVMAHGIYSESWADGGNRDFFQNTDITALRPEDMKRRRASRPGFDHLVLRKGKALAAIQSRVAQRASLIASIETKEQKVA